MTATSEKWEWPDAMVTRVVDGDTFVARVSRDLGFHGTAVFEQKLRLNRINAPAVSSANGKAAAKWAGTILQRTNVTITTVKPYKYGDEWMAEVTLPDGSNVSDLMVANGFAVYWNGAGARPADS